MIMSMRILNPRTVASTSSSVYKLLPQISTTASTVKSSLRATRLPQYTAQCQMSTQPCNAPEEDAIQMMLILGKPGGGKGTISEKLLKVCYYYCCCCCLAGRSKLQMVIVESHPHEFFSNCTVFFLHWQIDHGSLGLSTISSLVHWRFAASSCT